MHHTVTTPSQPTSVTLPSVSTPVRAVRVIVVREGRVISPRKKKIAPRTLTLASDLHMS